ncbi:TPA: hypothetical protein HA335_06065 [Methanocaldococcus jannaschii]|uniref:Uncharacterized protein n=1 Tax=Methanocaldococcus jannaschii TaxID=2190 RepID=A0A832T4X4_9EURY|nr:hypothetical protein [Methanocaldococcus jannaschii]
MIFRTSSKENVFNSSANLACLLGGEDCTRLQQYSHNKELLQLRNKSKEIISTFS